MNEKHTTADYGGAFGALIAEAEGRHAEQLKRLADTIAAATAERGLRMVLISGPTSSGKTTFSHRLCSALSVRGVKPVQISIDDYFVERDKTPRDAEGKYDFEAVEAVDLELLNDQLRRLTDGEEVTVPLYDFVSGLRKWHDTPLRLDDNSVVVLEGLHALNPRVAGLVDDNRKFRIFISCLTPAGGGLVSTYDNRMLRRIVRDNAHRGRTADRTIEQWPSVRRGEEKYVFPFFGDADTTFDSSLAYELHVLRPLAEPLLAAIADDAPEAGEAKRLLGLLSAFEPESGDEIPSESLLREFVGR